MWHLAYYMTLRTYLTKKVSYCLVFVQEQDATDNAFSERIQRVSLNLLLCCIIFWCETDHITSALPHLALMASLLCLYLHHADSIPIEISTQVGTSLTSRSRFQWISQQPMMIEACLNFLNTLPEANESHHNSRIYLHRKEMFYKFWWLQFPMATFNLHHAGKDNNRPHL